MDDKEVGELWRRRCCWSGLPSADPPTLVQLEFRDLIRKLVEERARWYREHNKVNPEIQSCLDFGISEDIWK